MVFTVLLAWLPLVCRDCLAHGAINPDYIDFPQPLPKGHCSEKGIQDVTTMDHALIHSSDPCNCGDMVVFQSTMKISPWDKIMNNAGEQLFVFQLINKPFPLGHIETASARPSRPDLPCNHPHKKFCIQLK